MLRKILAVSVSFSIVGVGVFFFFFYSPKEDIDLDEVRKQTTQQVALAYFQGNKGQPNDNIDPKKEVVYSFLTGMLDNNIDIFMSSFKPEVISKELFSNENPVKEEVVKSLIDRITRGDQLHKVQYKEVKDPFNKELIKLGLTIEYKDGRKAKVYLNVVPADTTKSNSSVFYVINTPIAEILQQIENSTK